MSAILHLASVDYGGAGRASLRVHQALMRNGVASRLLVRDSRSGVADVHAVSSTQPRLRLPRKVLQVAMRRIRFSERFHMYSVADRTFLGDCTEVRSDGFQPQAILLHWVADFVSLSDIKRLHEQYSCPVFWYCLDMAPLTGGCHFAWDCAQYEAECGDCPAAKGSSARRQVHAYFAEKSRVVQRSGVSALAPNRWVQSQIARSALPFGEAPLCYLPVDERVFCPSAGPPAASGPGFRVFFASSFDADERKGSHLFEQALQSLESMLLAGGRDPAEILVCHPGPVPDRLSARLRIRFESVPFAESEQDLAALYQSADCFVSASIEDSGPMMVVEAMMTGCPVVAFDVGVAVELVENDRSGFVVPTGDCEAMAAAMYQLSDMPKDEQERYGRRARDVVLPIAASQNFASRLMSALRLATG
ncbi:MAG: glycosyltransferase [Pseudomonadota bacterium]